MDFPGATRWAGFLGAFSLAISVSAQVMISGNEEKIDLASGTARLVSGGGHDTVSLLDFSVFPPKVTHLKNIPNTVIGPPSNIAVTPDGTLALIADSILPQVQGAGFAPNNKIHLLDLSARPPRVIGQVQAGSQPSGISITPDGKHALVANRADGTISVLKINGLSVTPLQSVSVCKPEESLSDVAISPDGKTVLASVQKGSCLAVLKMENGELSATTNKLSVYGQPYRVVITPDGQLAATAGQGFGNGVDRDAVSIVDMQLLRTVDYITVGMGPESVEISPDGKMLAVVVMNGSNLALDNPNRSRNGLLEILIRKDRTFERSESIPIGAIPEGVAFTPDGKYLVVQCHPAEELLVFEVDGRKVRNTNHKIKVPGKPSSLRSGPAITRK